MIDPSRRTLALLAGDAPFRKELKRIARKRSLNECDAENAVQQAFLSAFERERGDHETFQDLERARWWLRGAVRRHALSGARVTARVGLDESPRTRDPATDVTPESSLLGEERADEVARRRATFVTAIRHVPPEQQHLLETESERIEPASSTHRSRLRRARLLIASVLAQWGIGDARFLEANDNASPWCEHDARQKGDQEG